MEIEVKYSVPDEATLRRIGGEHELAGFKVGELRDKMVRDRYMDTADLRFYRAGFSCRLRLVGNTMLVTLKSITGGPASSALHERDEYEAEAGGDQPAQWAASEARDMGERIANGAQVAELFSLAQIRRVGNIYNGNRAIAELSLDHVRIEGDGRSEEFDELEAELREGSREDLDKLDKFFSEEYKLKPQPRSKFERALELLRPDLLETIKGSKKKGPGIEPEDSMTAAARKSIGFNLPKMVSKEEGTISGEDAEDLHDMRVATRRMRGAARIFGPYTGDDSLTRLGKRLRVTANALGAVRDLDVQLEQAREFKKTLGEGEQGDFDLLLEDWEDEREEARQRLINHLESKEYRRLKRDLGEFVDADEAAPDWAGVAEVEPYQVRHRAGSDIWEHYEAVLAYDTVADDPSEAQMHQVRITCKYLRYSLEFFEDVLPEAAGKMIADLAKVQDQLGAFHDAAVSIERLETYLGGLKKGKRKKQAGVQAYLNERQAKLAGMRDQFPAIWGQLSSKEFRKQLAGMIAAIGEE